MAIKTDCGFYHVAPCTTNTGCYLFVDVQCINNNKMSFSFAN